MKMIKHLSKYIFLDVDGVLNNKDWQPIDPKNVENLKYIIDNTGAKIVLSSSWRKIENRKDSFSWKCLNKYFQDYNLSIYSETPQIYEPDRGFEILKWLEDKKDYKFCVIDDTFEDSFRKYELTKFFVKTDWNTGLTKEDAEKAIKILSKTT